jgi:hypothetical protein
MNTYLEAANHLQYEPVTGFFTWLHIDAVRPHLRGKSAGCAYSDGYVYIRFNGKRLLAHRLAWIKVHKQMPDRQIDHINMCRSENRIDNLRLATLTDNNRNRKAQSNNTSGYKGVTFHKGTGRFQAKICVNKRRISLGYFESAERASIAYQKAAKEHHGDFARFQ